jgi:hypothetical protein
MEGLMNFGCFLAAEEERSEIDFSGGMAMRVEARVAVLRACQPVSLGCPLLFLGEGNGSHQLRPCHLPARISRIPLSLCGIS